MGLYERLIGLDGSTKLPLHAFQAVMAEFGRGRLTGAQAQNVINAISGEPLSPDEIAETQTLIATVTGTAMAKLARVVEIDHVLLLAEHRAPGYATPQELRTRLGV
jgi:hypothetical protein